MMRAKIVLQPLSQASELGKAPLQWSLDLWGESKEEFTADQWEIFYQKAAKADYENWDLNGHDQELIYLALIDNQVVGAISLCDFDDLEEFRDLKPWIAAFIVDPNLRGGGIGSEILRLMETKAIAFGVSEIYLWSENQNNFYLNRGYVNIKSIHKSGKVERVIKVYTKKIIT